MILFVDQFGDIGGAQTVLMTLLHVALDITDDVVLLAPGGGALQSEVQSLFGDRVRFVACEEPSLTRGSKGWRDLLRLAAYAWRFRLHLPLLHSQRLIYCNGSRQLPVIMLLSLLFRRKVIYHIHTEYGRMEKLIIRLAARMPATFEIVSNSLFIASRLGTRSKVIENALDRRYAGGNFVDRFMNDAASFQAAVIGRVTPQKGQDVAAQAVEGLPIDLHLIGPFDQVDDSWLAGLSKSNVSLEGFRHDVRETVERLGIQFNIVPSVCEEAFGLAAIEGMACSCLTIVSGRGGLSEVSQKTGALVAPDLPGLADMLKGLLATPRIDLAAMAKGQFEATQRVYAPARFEAKVASLLKAGCGTNSLAPHPSEQTK